MDKFIYKEITYSTRFFFFFFFLICDIDNSRFLMKSIKNIPGVAIDLRMQIRLSITVDPFGATPVPLGLVICSACRTGELYARAGIGTT